MTSKAQYTVFIAEDGEFARMQLAAYVSERKEIKLADFSENGEDAYQKLLSGKYDLLLLDVQLPVLSGIEIIERLETLPYIIFTTAYDEYSIKAFEIGAIDYLLKPISKARFNLAIDRFIERKKSKEVFSIAIKNKCLTFKQKRTQCIVPFANIIYLSSAGKQTIIHTEEKDFEASTILKEIEKKLPDNVFARIHKRYIVNIEYIIQFEYDRGWQYRVILKDTNETNLPVGKDYVSPLKKLLYKR